MIEGIEILFFLTSNTTAREQPMALKGDGFKTMHEGERLMKS